MKTSKFTLTSILAVAFLWLTPSCQAIYDDLDSCPQGVAFTFASSTRCEDEIDISSLTAMQIHVFDRENDKLVKVIDVDLPFDKNKIVDALYFNDHKKYRFAFWAASLDNNGQNLYEVSRGESWSLNSDKVRTAAELPQLFYGISEDQDFMLKKGMGTSVDTLAINLVPLMQNFKLRVTNLDEGDEYKVEWTQQDAPKSYETGYLDTPTDYTKYAECSNEMINVTIPVIKPMRGVGTKITIYNSTKKSKVAEFSLDEATRAISRQNPDADIAMIDCMRDVNMEVAREGSTALSITIAGWNAVLRDVDAE